MIAGGPVHFVSFRCGRFTVWAALPGMTRRLRTSGRLEASWDFGLLEIAMITVTSAEAQGRLAELLDRVADGQVTITREGLPDVVLISATEFEDLVDARRRNEAAAAFEAWKARAKRHLTPAAAELTDEDINRLVHELR